MLLRELLALVGVGLWLMQDKPKPAPKPEIVGWPPVCSVTGLPVQVRAEDITVTWSK